MADISKLRFDGTDYNVKDASAPARPLGNGYSKTGTLPISSTDTISEAIGKLENTADTNQTNILSIQTDLATKGTYSKPSGGIPKTDLASSVQASLNKADTALQSETYTGTVTQVKVGSTSYDPSSGVVSLPAYPDISGKIDTAGTGLSQSGTTLNHSNSVTAVTTVGAYKVKYDAQGHITGTASLSAYDLLLTNYSKGSSTAAVSSTDRITAAFAKHENRINALNTTIGDINSVLEGVL